MEDNMFFGRWYKVTEKLPTVRKRYLIAYKNRAGVFTGMETPWLENDHLRFLPSTIAWCEIKEYEE